MCEKLSMKRICCTVVNRSDNIEVRLGYNFSDELFNTVWDIAEELGIEDNIEICADGAGGHIEEIKKINGGHNKRGNLW